MLDAHSVKGANSRNEHYQTRKLQDYNPKQFCHCRRMIYDRINQTDNEGQRTEDQVHCLLK